MVQLQDVHVADRHGALERIAGAAVVQGRLSARRGQALGLGDVVRIGELEHAADLFFGGAVEHLHAPIIVRSEAVAQELMNDPAIAQSLERAAQADVLLAGVGGRVDRIDLSGQGYLEPHEWDELGAAGMVGDMCARFFDKDGQTVQHDVSSRVIGLTLEQLQKIPTRLIVAGGASKRVAVRAVLRAHLATVLVTDFKTAEDLLKKE